MYKSFLKGLWPDSCCKMDGEIKIETCHQQIGDVPTHVYTEVRYYSNERNPEITNMNILSFHRDAKTK